jgi:hypothetical protein
MRKSPMWKPLMRKPLMRKPPMRKQPPPLPEPSAGVVRLLGAAEPRGPVALLVAAAAAAAAVGRKPSEEVGGREELRWAAADRRCG